MKNIEFLENPTLYFNADEFIAYFPLVENVDDLFDNLRSILKFPDYFGDNWDALFDCLRDFYWIETKGIVLVHSELPKLNNDDLKNYLKLLEEASIDWKEGEKHYFKLVFPEKSKQLINNLLNH